MKIVKSSTRTTNLTFVQLVPGTVYKSTSGYYYLKTTDDRAVNVASGELNGANFFAGSTFIPIDAELIVK